MADRNARFWTWVNDGLVKITLRDRQALNHSSFSRHDEGWSAEYETWSLWDGLVTREVTTDGTDCDGRLTNYYSDECPIEDLRHHEAYDAPEYMVPEWRVMSQSQRDEYAEAAGY